MSSTSKQIIVSIIILGLGGLGGFGWSQQGLGREMTEKLAQINVVVTGHSKDIEAIRENAAHQKKDLLQFRDEATDRILKLADVVHTTQSSLEKIIESNSKATTEFIATIKTQNELLMQQSRQNTELMNRLRQTPKP